MILPVLAALGLPNVASLRDRPCLRAHPTVCAAVSRAPTVQGGLPMPSAPVAALVALFSLFPAVTPNPVSKNSTVALLAPGVDPCAMDPALCAPGASQQSESPEATDCSSYVRRGSIMLNLQARAAALQMVHAVVVFPGGSETERVLSCAPHALLTAQHIAPIRRTT